MSEEQTDGVISTRPYLLRAFYEWIVDNDWTPHIVIDSNLPGVSVPQQYVDEKGKIVLNISMTAVKDLEMTNQAIQFCARFSGVPVDLYAPIYAIEAIYAHENGRGIVFAEDEEDGGAPPPSAPPPPSTKSKDKPSKPAAKSRSHLKVVK